uniref:Uncharacterized protein n=1 Tax=Pristionchus pacificus TaxID=54126 RepID=A0A2A6BKT0_PRIPA|eukprot:PDM66509.1 hypothetical protein PRIPAC_47926 [Pristionchus pacificus]
MVHSSGWQSVCRGRAPCAVFHRIVYAVMPGHFHDMYFFRINPHTWEVLGRGAGGGEAAGSRCCTIAAEGGALTSTESDSISGRADRRRLGRAPETSQSTEGGVLEWAGTDSAEILTKPSNHAKLFTSNK